MAAMSEVSVGNLIRTAPDCRDSQLDSMDVHTKASEMFNVVDANGSGTIDHDEFTKLYIKIRSEVAAEHAKEEALEANATIATKRLKAALGVITVLFIMIGLSVAANVVLVNWRIEQNMITTMSPDALMLTKHSSKEVRAHALALTDTRSLFMSNRIECTSGAGCRALA